MLSETETTLYDRQNRLRYGCPVIPDSIAIVGCGGLGAWIGIFAALAGVKRFLLFDSDEIEEHNLNRLPYRVNDVGMRKTELLQIHIRALREDARVQCFSNLDEIALPLLERVKQVYVCVDRMRIRKLIDDHFTQLRIGGERTPLVIHTTAEEDHFSIERSVADSWDLNEQEDGYANPVGQWIVPQVMTAAFALAIGTGRIRYGNYSVDIMELARLAVGH